MEKNKPLKLTFRDVIGLLMLLFSAVILGILIVNTFNIISSTKDQFSSIKEVFGILLPVIGTWVGTIMAYYFSKENFEAASQNVSDLVKHVTSTEEKLREVKVTEVMTSPENFPYKTIDKSNKIEESDIKILELIFLMDNANSERYPILEKDTLKFIFLFYRSTLERFMIGYQHSTIGLKDKLRAIKPDDLTIKNMFESNYQLIKDVNELTKKKIFLSINATSEEARQMMQDNTLCQDIFVTKTGNRNEKVEGWITDKNIIEKSELFRKAVTRS